MIRNIKLNKSPILLNIDFKNSLDSYKAISGEILNERDKFIKTNTDFREKIYSFYNNNYDNNKFPNYLDGMKNYKIIDIRENYKSREINDIVDAINKVDNYFKIKK